MDASYIYILLAAPTNFVDNVYGAPADDVGSGWVTEPAAGGGAGGGKKKSKDAKKSKSGHTFKDLLGSDKVWFDVDVDGDGSADSYIELDYIELLSGQYAAKVLKDTDGLIQSVATSLQYNLSQGNTCAVRSGSTPVDSISGGTCVDQLMYEFSFLASDFTDFTLASLSNFGIHASPKKQGGSDTFVPCSVNCDPPPPPPPPPVSVPEPASFMLFLAGLVGLCRFRRRTPPV